MKRCLLYVLMIFILGIGSYLNAQTADGGIFGSGSTLTVKFKPSGDITGAFTGGNFGIRWLTSLGAGINLSGETGSFGYANQGAKATSGQYDYVVFASANNVASTTYTTGIEYTLMTVTVSGGVGIGSFELCPSGFAGEVGVWYIEIGGEDKANPSPAAWYYQQTASNVTLPVELSSFTASSNQNGVNLKWQTATEVNNYGFEIERKAHTSSLDFAREDNELSVTEWEKVGFVNGNGNSNSPKTYSFNDNNPSGGSRFLYRLKQIDNDGQFEYSDAVEVEIVPKEFALYQNYPNPFNPITKINYSVPFGSKVNISIYSITGEMVAELVNGFIEPGTYSVNFNGSNLASGMYFYRMAAGSFVKTNKMMLMK